MKTQSDSNQKTRSITRWVAALAATTAIMGATILLFPVITSDPGVLALTAALAGIIGLQIGLPPINPEEDWVRIGLNASEDFSEEVPAQITKTRKSPELPIEVPLPEPNTLPRPIILRSYQTREIVQILCKTDRLIDRRIPEQRNFLNAGAKKYSIPAQKGIEQKLSRN